LSGTTCEKNIAVRKCGEFWRQNKLKLMIGYSEIRMAKMQRGKSDVHEVPKNLIKIVYF